MEAFISLTASSSVGNWYIWTPLLTSSLMIFILNLWSSLLEIVSALAMMGIMLTWGEDEKRRVGSTKSLCWWFSVPNKVPVLKPLVLKCKHRIHYVLVWLLLIWHASSWQDKMYLCLSMMRDDAQRINQLFSVDHRSEQLTSLRQRVINTHCE